MQCVAQKALAKQNVTEGPTELGHIYILLGDNRNSLILLIVLGPVLGLYCVVFIYLGEVLATYEEFCPKYETNHA